MGIYVLAWLQKPLLDQNSFAGKIAAPAQTSMDFTESFSSKNIVYRLKIVIIRRDKKTEKIRARLQKRHFFRKFAAVYRHNKKLRK